MKNRADGRKDHGEARDDDPRGAAERGKADAGPQRRVGLVAAGTLPRGPEQLRRVLVLRLGLAPAAARRGEADAAGGDRLAAALPAGGRGADARSGDVGGTGRRAVPGAATGAYAEDDGAYARIVVVDVLAAAVRPGEAVGGAAGQPARGGAVRRGAGRVGGARSTDAGCGRLGRAAARGTAAARPSRRRRRRRRPSTAAGPPSRAAGCGAAAAAAGCRCRARAGPRRSSGGRGWLTGSSRGGSSASSSASSARAIAASRRAQSWNVGQTGNAEERQYASWCASARGAGRGSAIAAMAVVRRRATRVAIVLEGDEGARGGAVDDREPSVGHRADDNGAPRDATASARSAPLRSPGR